MFTSANSKILHPLFVVCQCGYGAKPRGPTSARSLTRYYRTRYRKRTGRYAGVSSW
jgi:hypothetical protein